MRSRLGEVASTADRVADDQHEVAERVRELQRLRRRGRSWASILDQESAPGVLDLLRRGGRGIAASTSQLARTFAHGLAAEGESQRQIARRLGVTHQRVAAILNHRSTREPQR
jgi:hypothetical protein